MTNWREWTSLIVHLPPESRKLYSKIGTINASKPVERGYPKRQIYEFGLGNVYLFFSSIQIVVDFKQTVDALRILC